MLDYKIYFIKYTCIFLCAYYFILICELNSFCQYIIIILYRSHERALFNNDKHATADSGTCSRNMYVFILYSFFFVVAEVKVENRNLTFCTNYKNDILQQPEYDNQNIALIFRTYGYIITHKNIFYTNIRGLVVLGGR